MLFGVPWQNLPAASNRWSFSYPGAVFTSAQVTITGPSGNVPVTLEPLATGFGDNTIVFMPTGISYAKPSADTSYTVTVSGVGGTGVPATFSYTVTIIDPDATPPAPPSATAFEYYNASLDHYFVTHVAAEIALLDAGVTIRGWVRTGQSFKVYTASVAGASAVCRFYIPPARGDSHFYGRGPTECANTGAANPSFVNEDPQFLIASARRARHRKPGGDPIHHGPQYGSRRRAAGRSRSAQVARLVTGGSEMRIIAFVTDAVNCVVHLRATAPSLGFRSHATGL